MCNSSIFYILLYTILGLGQREGRGGHHGWSDDGMHVAENKRVFVRLCVLVVSWLRPDSAIFNFFTSRIKTGSRIKIITS